MEHNTCKGERCRICKEPAQHKVAEEVPQTEELCQRHGFTAYVCSPCFIEIFGPKAENFCDQ